MQKMDTDELVGEDDPLLATRSPFFHVGHMMSRYHVRMSASLKPYGIDVPRWRVLMTLADGAPLTVSGIAEECVVYLSTMAKIINRMSNQGLVSTQPSRLDARSIDVTITAEGLRVLESVRERANRVWSEALRGITGAETKMLNSVSIRIYDNLAP